MASGDEAVESVPVDVTPEVVKRLRAGDAEAGRLLDKLYRVPITRFCMGYLGRTEEAEDATQEIFVKVIAARETPQNFRAYLYRAARNHCINAIRDRAKFRKQKGIPADAPISIPESGFLTKLVKKENHSKLAQLVVSLTESQREALRLRYTEGLSRSEIAEVLDLPESVVKSRLFEGLKKLREHTSLIDIP